VSGTHDPRDVLAAVRRLEADLDDMRQRAATAAPPPSHMDVSEQKALVEDLEVLVDLVGSSWRTTRQEVAAVAQELADLKRMADEARDALKDMRFELRLVKDEAQVTPHRSPY
jgi:predicted  nucleic acid-binding Zn-ribbon protein